MSEKQQFGGRGAEIYEEVEREKREKERVGFFSHQEIDGRKGV